MAQDEELLIGTLTLSKKSMKARRINIDKKTTVFIGYDPFSFLTEVHEISTVMKRKGWKSDLEAKKLGGPVKNKHASQYSNAEILSWRSMTQDVFLYGIVNDIPLFKAQLLEMKE